MPTDPWQAGGLMAIVASVFAFARKAVRVSSMELRVVDPKAETEIAKLREALRVTTDQLNAARVDLATVRTELLGLHSMRSEFQEERNAWQDERGRLRAHILRLERDLRLREREDDPHGQGDGTQDG